MSWWFRPQKKQQEPKFREAAPFRAYQPKPMQQEPFLGVQDGAQDVVPTLFVGLGPTALEALRWLKMALWWEEAGSAGMLLSFLCILNNPVKEDIYPLSDLDILSLEVDLSLSPPWSPEWWRTEFAQDSLAVMPQGRMLWLWDQKVLHRVSKALKVRAQQLGSEFQLFLLGNPGEYEFGMWHELAQWSRSQLPGLEKIYTVPIIFGHTLNPELLGAIFRHLAYVGGRHFYFAIEGQRRVFKQNPIVDKIFIFYTPTKHRWMNSFSDVIFPFLDKHVSHKMAKHLDGVLFLVEGSQSVALPVGFMGEQCVLYTLHSLCIADDEARYGEGERLLQAFLEQRIEEVDGDYPFWELWAIYRNEKTEFPPVYPPKNFQEGWRWRLEVFLNKIMNESSALAQGLKRARLFIKALQRWWRDLDTTLQAKVAFAHPEPPIGVLASVWKDINEVIQFFDQALLEWEMHWGLSEGAHLATVQDYINKRAQQYALFKTHFQTEEEVAFWKKTMPEQDMDVCAVAWKLREGLRWGWREVQGKPFLVLESRWQELPCLTEPSSWEAWLDKVAQLTVRSFWFGLGSHLTLTPSQVQDWKPWSGFSSEKRRALVSQFQVPEIEDRTFFFYPLTWDSDPSWTSYRHRLVLFQQGTQGFLTWNFFHRATWLQLVKVKPEFFAKSWEGPCRPDFFAYSEEQRFAELEQQGCILQWNPDFVALLAAKEDLDQLCLAWLYGKLQFQGDRLYIPPDVFSPTMLARSLLEAFRIALSQKGEMDWSVWWNRFLQAWNTQLAEERSKSYRERRRMLDAMQERVDRLRHRYEHNMEMETFLQYLEYLINKEAYIYV